MNIIMNIIMNYIINFKLNMAFPALTFESGECLLKVVRRLCKAVAVGAIRLDFISFSFLSANDLRRKGLGQPVDDPGALSLAFPSSAYPETSQFQIRTVKATTNKKFNNFKYIISK